MPETSRQMPERQWFVYYDVEYYPWAEIVSAPTAEDAVKHLSEYERRKGTCVAVCPADDIQIIAQTDEDARRFRSALLDEGER